MHAVKHQLHRCNTEPQGSHRWLPHDVTMSVANRWQNSGPSSPSGSAPTLHATRSNSPEAIVQLLPSLLPRLQHAAILYTCRNTLTIATGSACYPLFPGCAKHVSMSVTAIPELIRHKCATRTLLLLPSLLLPNHCYCQYCCVRCQLLATPHCTAATAAAAAPLLAPLPPAAPPR
jgi:hypothetical protein